jgi:DNA ligase (NAD+)
MINDLLDKASKEYYAGKPFMSDAAFDRLAEVSGYNKIGTDAVKGIPHFYRMYSLQKVHFGEESSAPYLKDPYQTPKLDGAAISLLYICNPGENTFALIQILTRGDGIKGQDVTDKLRHLVPSTVIFQYPAAVIQINAEVVAPASVENSRNYAAGALNLKSVEEVKTRDIEIVAHDCQPNLCDTYYDTLGALWHAGFKTVKGNCSKFPTDGFVIRENNYDTFTAAGYTSKHPRAAYALKPKPTAVTTKLIDVEWQVGRTGVVSPVAILEPVSVGDAMVSRATLHNIEYIRALNLELGCTVELIRSGEIIPRIIGRVDE